MNEESKGLGTVVVEEGDWVPNLHLFSLSLCVACGIWNPSVIGTG